jgi:glycosyltransferase involved in cell wall biosynthesis
MKICIITGIFPPDIGGPATYVSHLAHLLNELGHEVCIITLGDDAILHPFLVKRIYRSYPLPLRLTLLFVAMIRYGWKSDVWYINGLELPAVLAGRFLRKRMVMKIVGDYAWERAMNAGMTNDSIDEFQHKKQPWNVELHKHLRAWYTGQVEKVITPSQYLKRLIQGWGIPTERIQVIYNAVDKLPENFRSCPEIREQLGLTGDDTVVITVGRLVRWKGVEQLLRTMVFFDNSLKLLIVGDGPEKNKLTDLAESLSVTNRVKFLGKTDRLQVLEYIKASDIFVLNTGYEGFSHVLLEAMMVGTPVITTAVCGNPELITHQKNGLLVEPHSDDLFEHIDCLLQNVSLQKRLSEAGKAVGQQYTWERLLQETTEVLCDY